MALMRAQAMARGLNLDLDYDEDIPNTITSDPNRIRQVVINLIGNALKFTEQGGIAIKACLTS